MSENIKQNDNEDSKIKENLEEISDVIEVPEAEQEVSERQQKDVVKDEAYYQKLNKQKEDEGIAHLGRPLWFSKLIVRKTWLVLTITLSISVILSVVALALGAGTLSPNNTRDYLVWSDKKVKEYDMIELATEKLVTDYPNSIQPLRSLTNDEWTTSVTFECSSCSTILTVDYVTQMYNIEQLVAGNSEFSSFCEARSFTDSSCSTDSYKSFSEYFASQITAGTLTQTDIDNFLSQIASDSSLYNEYYIYLDTGFTQSNLVSKKARAIFLFGQPIEKGGKRYKSYLDDPAGQTLEFTDWSFDREDDVKDYNTDLDVDLYSDAWFDAKIQIYIIQDFILAAVSFVFVMIYVAVHLGSAFLGGTAMLGVLLSYPVTLFINRFIFQITFFMSLNFCAIFVVCGVAADDVFVFTDAWNQTATYEQLNDPNDDKLTNYEKRMNYTWRRAFKSMLTTSCTTLVAFLATGFSRLMPISAFGFFSATLIFINFFYANVTYPCFLILYEKYVKDRCKYKGWCKTKCAKLFKCSKKEEKVSNEESVEDKLARNSSNNQDSGDIEANVKHKSQIAAIHINNDGNSDKVKSGSKHDYLFLSSNLF